MNKILIGLFLSLICVTFVFAQNQYAENEVEEQEVFEPTSVEPDLYLDEINLIQDEYTTGGLLMGSFSIFNTGERTASNVSYSIDLYTVSEEDGEFFPISLVHSSEKNSVGVVSPGKKEIQFSYRIPEILPSDEQFAIYINAYDGEINSANEYAVLNIKGNLVDFINYDSTFLNIEDEFFLLSEGPTIKVDENIRLNVELYNERPLTNLVPTLKVYSGSDMRGNMVYNTDFEPINIELANNIYIVAYDLPTNFKSGVYTAALTFSKDGKNVSEILEARYIIDKDGLKPSIASIDLNNLNQNEIDKFLVSVSFADVPVNHRLDANGNFVDPNANAYFIKDAVNLSDEELAQKAGLESSSLLPSGMTLEVSLFDTKTNRIIDTKNLSNLVALTDVEFQPIRNSDSVKIVVSLKDNGETIETKESIVDIIPKRGGWNFLDGIFGDPKKAGVAGGIFLIVVLVIAVFASKARKNKTVTSLSIIFAALIIAGSLVLLDDTKSVNAGTVYTVNVDVNNPKPPSVRSYEPGETIRFNADFQFIYCSNEWHTVKGRASDPVLKGRAHKSLGPWKLRGSSQLNAVEKKALVNQVKKESPQKLKNSNQKAVPNQSKRIWTSTYTDSFKAPNQPGIYWFKYEFLVENGQGTGLTRSGVSTFKVEADQCTNLANTQGKVPVGYTQTRNANGDLICNKNNVDTPVSGLQCSASKNRLAVGETVRYTANRVDGLRANFSWFKGNSTNVASVKSESNVIESSYSTSYSTPGLYLVTVLSKDAVGNESFCKVGVSVGEDFENVPLDEESVEEFLEDYYVDPDTGERYPLDRNAGAGKIEFNMEEGLTNKTCKADWSAQNVLKCSLFKNNIKVKDVGLTGNEDLGAGTYQIRCIQANNGAEIKSTTRTCTLNPDIREF